MHTQYGRGMGNVNSGLEGVVAATTRLSHVDGERGELIIAGYPIAELAPRASFEETTWLLWHGELPSAAELISLSWAGPLSNRPIPSEQFELFINRWKGLYDPG